LSPALTADLNSFQNAEKSDDCANAFGNDNKIKTPANQVSGLIRRIDANECNPDDLILPLRAPFSTL
jgi:hypothetical protein